MQIKELIAQTRNCLGAQACIFTGKSLDRYNLGFRGKQGRALFAVFPTSLLDLYRLIMLYRDLKVGYLLQGANTSLKGQSTPNVNSKPIVIIKTLKLNKFKIFDLPTTKEYKVILVEPGLALKELESTLTQLGYDLPHKIGSHDFGNTFGGSCAIGCGGVRVDNKSGAPVMTEAGSLGVISLSATGIFYNGIFKPAAAPSGQVLLQKIDSDAIQFSDLELPCLDEVPEFLKGLFIPKSYPIQNKLHDNIFSGQGYEGTQAILLMMYLVRKKVKKTHTYVIPLANPTLKEALYQEVIFKIGAKDPDALPILCESMSANLVRAITVDGVAYPAALFLALMPKFLTRYYVPLLNLRKRISKHWPLFYAKCEDRFGRFLSRLFTPKELFNDFAELLILQVAERHDTHPYLDEFAARLKCFVRQHPLPIMTLTSKSFNERLILQLRNVAALATLSLAEREQGQLFAFDDAIMPGTLTQKYCALLATRLGARFPKAHLAMYLYAHDLKQICHDDWIISFADHRRLTPEEISEINKIQHTTIMEAQGIAHAEHGLGDEADLHLDTDNLVRLLAHRFINDPEGLANPGGGFERAYQRALLDPSLITAAKALQHTLVTKERSKGRLLTFSGYF